MAEIPGSYTKQCYCPICEELFTTQVGVRWWIEKSRGGKCYPVLVCSRCLTLEQAIKTGKRPEDGEVNRERKAN